MRYLPNAFAFIYVIDVSHAGGVQEDLKKKVKILKYNVALHINTQYCTVQYIGSHLLYVRVWLSRPRIYHMLNLIKDNKAHLMPLNIKEFFEMKKK